MGRTPRVRALHSDASRARLAMGDLDADVAENAKTGTRKKRRAISGSRKLESRTGVCFREVRLASSG